MGNIIEIRWHGRGGQGAVTAAKVLAEAALSGGKYVQAFPEYGPERMGAPLRAYNRISDTPISIHCQVANPEIVVVIDPTLIDNVDVVQGTPEEATFIINTPESAEKMKEKLNTPKAKVFTIDATKISIETLGRPMPNTPVLGALAKATGLINIDRLIEETKNMLGKKLGEKVVNDNINAIKRAYQEVTGG